MAADKTLVDGAYKAVRGDRSVVNKAMRRQSEGMQKGLESLVKKEGSIGDKLKARKAKKAAADAEAEYIDKVKKGTATQEERDAADNRTSEVTQNYLEEKIDEETVTDKDGNVYNANDGSTDLTMALSEANAKATREAAEEEAQNQVDQGNANQILQTDGSANSQDFEVVKEQVVAGKELVLNDNPEKANAKLNEATQVAASLKGTLVQVAENTSDSKTGFSNSRSPEDKIWCSSVLDQSTANIVTQSVTDPQGNEVQLQGMLGPGPEFNFMTMSGVDNYVSAMEFDVDSANSFTELREDLSSPDAIKAMGKNGRWNGSEVSNKVGTWIKDGDINSLMHDNIFGDKSFVDDLKAAKFDIKYAELNINVSEFDTNGDDVINEDDNLSADDMEVVIDAYISSADKAIVEDREGLLNEYYVRHIQTNWENNYLATYPAEAEQINTPNTSTNAAPSLRVDLPGAPKRSLSEEEKLKAQLERKNKSGHSTMDYINMIQP